MNKVLSSLAKLIGVHFVPANYVAPVFRLGTYNRVCGPGFFWVIPILESVGQPIKSGFRFTSLKVPGALSKDGIPIDIDLEVFFRFDPERTQRQIAEQLVRAPEHVLTDIAKSYADSFMRRVVANFAAEDICTGKAVNLIQAQLSHILADRLEFLGYVINLDSGVLIKAITASPEFQQTMLDAKRYEVILRVLSAYEAADVDRALFAELVNSLAKGGESWRLADWRAGHDPYIVGDVVEEPEKFYGREQALADLLRALEAGNHMALYGERRIGKTSLLHQLAHRLREMGDALGAYLYLPVFLNLQMVPEARFFYALMRAIAGVARRYLADYGQTAPLSLADERPEGYDSLDMADDLEEVLESLQKVTDRPVRFVLLLDEADKMNGYDPHTQEGLRGLLMTPLGRQVKLVWSGQTMNREWHLETSPWFNLFKHEINLVGLEEEAAVRLIRQPVKGVFTYDDEAVTRILHYSDRRPYTIQRLCSLCVRQLLAEDRFRVTVEDVETAYRAMQDEDARRAAEEAAPQAIYAPQAPAQSLAEDQGEYNADESYSEEEG